MKEKDIKIITLSDDKLQIFSPPSSINQFPKNISHIPNNESNHTIIYPNKAGFTFVSKVEYLGSGGFSKVYKFRGDLENKAVKKIISDPKYYSKVLTAEDSIKREVYGMTKINCDHSLKVFGVYQNKEKNIFYILMEQCDGNIENYVNNRGYPLNINEILILLSQLNEAFYLLEKNNIIHRDIKPSNILYKEEKDLDNNNNKYINKKIFEGKKLSFKLGDYGVCIPLYDKKFSKSQFMGTLDYMAPEIYEMKCEKEHPIYTQKIDLFSLGQSILWLMGFFPKANTLTKNKVEEYRNNCKWFNGNQKEKLLADLVFNHLLIFDVEKRDSWEEYFKHPLFDEYSMNNLSGNDYKNYTDGYSQRVNKRVIQRNNFEIGTKSKLFHTEKKLDITNKLNLKSNNQENNKININKIIPIYKYKINPNPETRPLIKSMINNTHIINHKNTVINIRKEPKEKKYEANTAKIEKKKTYDFFQKKNSKSIQKNEKYRYKNYINDNNSHFISIRNKYKQMSLNNKDIKNNRKGMNIVIDLDDKKEKKTMKKNLSFIKEKRSNSKEKEKEKEKLSRSYKKDYSLRNKIIPISKKNTLMKSVQLDKKRNDIFNNNNMENNNYIVNIREKNDDRNNNNNIKIINLDNNINLKTKKYTSIKVINYRVEENKKNKNVGFYFSKYSSITSKSNKDNIKSS
jgi:serine/threonine protein kinase